MPKPDGQSDLPMTERDANNNEPEIINNHPRISAIFDLQAFFSPLIQQVVVKYKAEVIL
jgi:hypothetical protein